MEKGKVYLELKNQILNLTLKPGSELNLNTLASSFGVSRSPVRDALKELATANLVEIFPQKGTIVSKINLGKADDERFIRLNLELGAMEGFMQKKTINEIHEMRNLLEEQKKAFLKRDLPLFISLDDKFHQVIFRVAGREHVFDLILSQSGNYHRMRMISFMFDNIVQNVLSGHEELLLAIEANDINRLSELDRKHISKLVHETDSFRLEMPEYFA